MEITKVRNKSVLLGTALWLGVVMVYYLILTTLKNGISCDEGFYLMGYLRKQAIEPLGSDFHYIVRFLSVGIADDSIMAYRYLRLGLYAIAILFFAVTSYYWLKKSKGLALKSYVYYPLVLLAGAMDYTFAAPTISYDHLGVIFFLFTSSFLFLSFELSSKHLQRISVAITGFFIWYGFVNYPPAGAAFGIIILMIILLEQWEKKWGYILFLMMGFLIAIASYQFIHPLQDYFQGLYDTTIKTFTEKSQSRHDSQSLISTLFLTIGKLLLWVIPACVLLTILLKKIRIVQWIYWVIIIAACGVLVCYKPIFKLYGTIYLIPLVIAMATVLAQSDFDIKKFVLSKSFFVVLLFAAIPIIGVFGTNQVLMRKAIIFTPFWLVAYCVIRGAMSDQNRFEKIDIFLFVMMVMGYVYLGNFSRYHYYYTPRSSKFELESVERGKGILVSGYQKEYFEEVIDSLYSNGFHSGDRCVAFGENQITAYLAGGYFAGSLPYHWWQYKHRPADPPKSLILFKSEEEDVLAYLSSDGWDIENKYHRMEFRQMSENLGEEYRTVVYIKNGQDNDY